MTPSQASVSIVCVYNKRAVREECLDRSIQELSGEAANVEYLPVDNTKGEYPSAGAALNHGASLAKNDVVVCAHQDVYLHSLAALKDAAGLMQLGGFGLLGATGIRSGGQLVGRIRDRVLLAGEPVTNPIEVDSVDEVLLMVPRSQLLNEPLAASHDLAWHAYAVEYGLRIRRKGLRVGVANIPLTHNSLTANLNRLDKAHQAVARSYADLLPVYTTCGRISNSTIAENRHVWFASHRWRYRWLRDSMVLQRSRNAAGRVPSVLAEMRLDIDDVIECAPERQLNILNCSTGNPFAVGNPKPVELSRGAGTVVFSDCEISEVPATLASCPATSWTLITNLTEQDIRFLRRQLPKTAGVLGFHHAEGLWLLLGPSLLQLPPRWRSNRATPLGPPAIVGAPFLR